MSRTPIHKTTIVAAAASVLLLGGALAGCAADSLALHAATTPTTSVATAATTNGGAPVASGGAAASAGLVQGRPASIRPSLAVAPSAPSMAIAADVAAPLAPSGTVAAHGIAVTGTGSVEARPDEAIVSVGVQTRASTAQEAQANNNTSMQAVIAAIKALNIPAKDIHTSGVSLYPVVEKGNTVTGYNAMNNVTVTVENIDQTGAVLDSAVKAGANTASNVSFTFKDATTLRNKALQAAAADARSKADALAGALGLKITGIESVAEGQINIPRPLAAPAAMSAAGVAPSVPIEPGQQSVTADVTVVFGY